jgi:hypothetical protein
MTGRKNTAARDWVETITFWVVGIGLCVIPLLVFIFSFGNVGGFLESLGMPHRIAYLTGPAIDLAAMVCVVASSYLATRDLVGVTLWPLHFSTFVCGVMMILLNTAGALHDRHWRLAGVDCVGPLLLIGWGALAPWLWRSLTAARRSMPPSTAAPAGPAATRRQVLAAALPMPGGTADAASPMPLPPGAGAAPLPPSTAARHPRAAARADGDNVFEINSPAQWAVLALPLWDQHIEKIGSTPTAKELCALLRRAHPLHNVPPSERAERNIRTATEELAKKPRKTEGKIEREEVG